MTELVLTQEQARLVREEPVQMIVLDPQGEVSERYFDVPLTPERVAKLKRRAKEGPFLTTAEILAHLDAKINEDQPASKPLTGAA